MIGKTNSNIFSTVARPSRLPKPADPPRTTNLTHKTAAQEPFQPLMRSLVTSYQAFYSYADKHIRSLGLTLPQFDVIVTLGNTDGMLMNELAEKTLVTKGTLTGIVDRLEQKDYVRREIPPNNRRCFRVVLTAQGEALFKQIFPAHIEYLKDRFDRLSPTELAAVKAAFDQLRDLFAD
ncbi:MAG: MarR family transcriptional regulator [Alkalinema sp. RL_2_19]|nr:MarR family transcriptional regulator [Alkalinema sp. RL_2_19]